MLIFERVEDSKHPDFEAAFAIYESSFPQFERRVRADQIRALQDKDYHFNLIKDTQQQLLGIVLTWQFNGFVYVEHLAIAKEARGQNIGTTTLTYLKNHNHKALLLEIDPPLDSVSIKRKQFYEKAGFVDTGMEYTHYSYQQQPRPHSLKIMAFPALAKQEFEQFLNFVQARVMVYSQQKIKVEA